MASTCCFTGSVKHDEKPRGRISTIHGRQTYVAEPTNGQKPLGLVVIVPDAFGLPFINNKVLADHYAEKGQFKVYLPDFMDGTSAPTWTLYSMGRVLATSTLTDWITKPYHIGWTMYGFLPWALRNRFSVSMPKVVSYFSAVRQAEGSLPVFSAGFCWGAQHVIHLAAGLQDNGRQLCDAHFMAHPSNLRVPVDFENVKLPLSLAIGDRDFVMSLQQAQEAEAVLRRQPEVKSEVVIYPGAGHGFAVRADLGNEKVTQQALDAEDQAIKFWQSCL